MPEEHLPLPITCLDPFLKNMRAASPNFPAASLLRINLTYLARHGRLPDLAEPETFTELVQRRKLQDHNPVFPLMADKLAVKKIVADRLSPEWVTPTLWSGAKLPAEPKWEFPFVVKSRHGCNQIAFVRQRDANWPKIRRDAEEWVKRTYGFWLDEWLYKHIPHGLLIEPFIGCGNVVPVDYKFYVFNGQVVFIQVHLDRQSDHRWILLDRDWRRVSAVSGDGDPVAPRSLQDMIAAAEILGQGIDFVRVDLYEPAGSPVFGEMTFYPGSGLDPFNPVSLDKVIGSEWLRARTAMDQKLTDPRLVTPSSGHEYPHNAAASL